MASRLHPSAVDEPSSCPIMVPVRPGSQKSRHSPSVPQPAQPKRKRSSEDKASAHDTRPVKRPRQSSSPVDQGSPSEPPPLSSEDSQALQEIYSQVMASVATGSSHRRPSSSARRSKATSTARTHGTSTNALYRRVNLKSANVRFYTRPPDNVMAVVQGILDAKTTEDREAKLEVVQETFRDDHLSHVKAQSNEDDFLDPLETAMKALRHEGLRLHKKSLWRTELLPVIPNPEFYLNPAFMLDKQPRDVDETAIDDASPPAASAAPRKRLRTSAEKEYISPQTSKGQESALPPVAVENEEHCSPVKIPLSDLSLGIHIDAFVSALSLRGFGKSKTEKLFDWLHGEVLSRGQRQPPEPRLLLAPGVRSSDLICPFLLVEGKAYSTGKQIFEAENQAAVGAAAAHKILFSLDSMAGVSSREPRVVFSITTQGAIHELWMHWMTEEFNQHVFESMICGSWNVLLAEQARDFVFKLDRICVWGAGQFFKSVVDAFEIIARQAVEEGGSGVQRS